MTHLRAQRYGGQAALAITKDQIKAIHTLKSRHGLDDATYRQFLERETGKRSSKVLTMSEASAVIDRLKGKATPLPVRSAPASPARGEAIERASSASRKGLDGPYAAKLRALWISAWHLGIAADRRDSALIAFVKRQTGIEHTRWLRDPADAAKAIEGLKAWVAREGGVRWQETIDPKRCVVLAQLRRLAEPLAIPDGTDLDALMASLGDELRARKAHQ